MLKNVVTKVNKLDEKPGFGAIPKVVVGAGQPQGVAAGPPGQALGGVGAG